MTFKPLENQGVESTNATLRLPPRNSTGEGPEQGGEDEDEETISAKLLPPPPQRSTEAEARTRWRVRRGDRHLHLDQGGDEFKARRTATFTSVKVVRVNKKTLFPCSLQRACVSVI